jgi:hypothetical protein
MLNAWPQAQACSDRCVTPSAGDNARCPAHDLRTIIPAKRDFTLLAVIREHVQRWPSAGVRHRVRELQADVLRDTMIVSS